MNLQIAQVYLQHAIRRWPRGRGRT
jgi:hypothetical protein